MKKARLDDAQALPARPDERYAGVAPGARFQARGFYSD
jgi:hypothetical protein